MGKRAKKQAVVTKKRPTLAKRFKCPFCANEDVVECKMDQSRGVGSLSCRVCGASYQMPIHHLHEPVDVFSEWLDDCEAAERGDVAERSRQSAGGLRGAVAGYVGGGAAVHDTSVDHYEDDDDEEEDDLPEPSGLGRKKSAEKEKEEEGGGGGKKGSGAGLGLDDSDDEDSE